jgi:hypothetical protein
MKSHIKSVLKFVSLFFTFILLCFLKSYSQSEYRTTNGYVIIAGMYKDSAFFAESHKLVLEYNPATKVVFGKINLENISSEIPFIDSTLSVKNGFVTFSGFIPVDFLSWDHNDYLLDIPLEIDFDHKKTTTTAKLKFSHVDKLMNYTCMLEANFKLRLADFDILLPNQIGTDINVQFLQLMLRRNRK